MAEVTAPATGRSGGKDRGQFWRRQRAAKELGDLHNEWPVVGWRASGEARDDVARHLEATGRPPNAL